ncbi:MAG TPA: hypothetical protein VM327_04230 [Candidatus Thermoplasmatota archaeon]|nr:hypothetical protein [Candidatus Thermoplasmatota archaeon]
MTPRGEAALAAVAAAACLAALAAALFLPWMSSAAGPGPERQMHWPDLARSALAYERALAWWPLVGLPIASVTLAAASVLSWRAAAGGRLALVSWAVAGTAAFPAALAGTRLLGFQVARALDPGATVVTLEVSSYAVLAAAAMTLVACAWRVRVRVGLHAMFAPPLACAATLLALPLLPFGTAQGGPTAFHYDELTLALAADGPESALHDAANALAWARWALWASMLTGLAAGSATLRSPTPDAARWVARLARWLPVPALLGAALLTARFEWQWLQLDDVRTGLNHLLPAGVLAAAALQAMASRTAKADTGKRPARKG